MTYPAFLIVDDDAMLRLVLRRLIARCYPYAVVYSAGSVREARDQLVSSAPTVVFTDYHLLDGTGHDVLAAVQLYMPGIPVVVISGDTGIAKRALQACAIAFIAKPYDTHAVMLLVKQLGEQQCLAA